MIFKKHSACFIILLIPWVVSRKCSPGSWTAITDDCDEVSGTLLIKNVENEQKLRDTLTGIKSIYGTVVVEENQMEKFDALDSLKSASNDDGPVFIFRKNPKLKRIEFGALESLKSKQHVIEFDRDNFPRAAYESPDAFSNLMRLRSLSKKDNESCSTSFMKIKEEPEEDQSNTKLIIVVIILVIVVLLDVVTGLTFWRLKRKNKQKLNKRKSKKSQKQEETVDVVKEKTSGKTDKSAEKTSGSKEKSNSKEDAAKK